MFENISHLPIRELSKLRDLDYQRLRYACIRGLVEGATKIGCHWYAPVSLSEVPKRERKQSGGHTSHVPRGKERASRWIDALAENYTIATIAAREGFSKAYVYSNMERWYPGATRELRKERTAKHRAERLTKSERLCIVCGGLFTHINPQRKTCTAECRGRLMTTKNRKYENIADAFWDQVVEPDDPDACWGWTGPKSNGYGMVCRRFRHIRGFMSAHRFSWEFHNKQEVPPGYELHHNCPDQSRSNRACVNPRHLLPVTRSEHIALGSRCRRTHCKRGHEFTLENTYRHKLGRLCRTCASLRYIKRKENNP